MFLEVVTSVILYKSPKAQRNCGTDQRGALTCYANGNHGNNMWMDGQLRVYSKFKFCSERSLIEGFRSYSLKCLTVSVRLVTDQSKSHLMYSESWDCAEFTRLSRVSAIFKNQDSRWERPVVPARCSKSSCLYFHALEHNNNKHFMTEERKINLITITKHCYNGGSYWVECQLAALVSYLSSHGKIRQQTAV